MWTSFEVVPTIHPKHSHRKHHQKKKKGVKPSAKELELSATLLQPHCAPAAPDSPETHTQCICSQLLHTLHGMGGMLSTERKAIQYFVLGPLFIAWSQALFTSHHSSTTLMTEFVISSFLLG